MIIYQGTIAGFNDDVDSGIISEKLESMKRYCLNEGTSEGEIRSWDNSLKNMSLVFSRSTLPDDVSVSLEYNIPYTDKRIDMIVSGKGENDRCAAVIIELKQWSSAEKVEEKDGIVKTFLNGKVRETTHPSYQAWAYAAAIQDFNADIQDSDVLLQPCAFLHNYRAEGADDLLDPIYHEYFVRAPIFDKHGVTKLREFLQRFIKKGDKGETIFLIDRGRLRPSKSLQDSLASMIKGNREFILLDSQKVAYEEIMQNLIRVQKGGRKTVCVVTGGPGTGKSVLAVNLLAEAINRNIAAMYVSKNAAPREVYRVKLKGHEKASRIDFLFKGSGSFVDVPENKIDLILADESHRLNEKSGLFHNKGENQIKEIINASRMSVFFIDEHQTVTLNDIGSVREIVRHANAAGAYVHKMELDSQFRCGGSDGYISWLDNMLGFENSIDLEPTFGFDYDLRFFDDPCRMRDEIRELNRKNNKSRLVAGYCYNWVSKDDPDAYDVTIPGTEFRMKWNLSTSKTWAIDEDSVEQIGCIHTCQGLEFDYVGVIIGKDLRFEDGKVITDRTKRARTDQSLRGLSKKYPDPVRQEEVADDIIRNTYKVLLSRGMKGCFIYCEDTEFQNYLEESFRKLHPIA